MAQAQLRRMDESERHYLASASRSLGLTLNDQQIDQLLGYVDLLEKWNRAYNLTAVRDRRGIIERHIIESLSIQPFIIGRRRIDVGTGAGLPGIPLAVADCQQHYTLLDSNGKKTRFLKEVKRQLGLSNITIVNTRIETWLPAERFDAVITRAFADLAVTAHNTEHVLTETGCLFAMKTDSASEEALRIPRRFRLSQAHDVCPAGRDWTFRLLVIERQHTEAI